MNVIWLRSGWPNNTMAVIAVACVSLSPQALHAASACAGNGTIVTTCAEHFSDAQHDFLKQRKHRAITLEPEDSQVSSRISGQAWDPGANGGSPVDLAPAGTVVELRTSLSKWGAYFARQDADKIEKVEDFLAEEVELPAPASARSKKLDVWGSTKIAGFAPGSSRHGFVSHFGADYTVSGDFLVGASVEFEELEQYSDLPAGATAAGAAFMVGPYMARRLADHLVFDARLAWGESTDRVAVGEVANRFVTERTLAKARLEGDFELFDWQVSSSAAFIHAAEVPEVGPASGVVTNKITLGPALRRSFHLEDGHVIEPFLHYHNSADLDAVDGGDGLDSLAFEGGLGGGVTVVAPDDYKLQATTAINSLDTDADPNVTGRVQITVPLP